MKFVPQVIIHCPFSYYTDGRTAKLPEFTSIELLDRFIEETKSASEKVNKYQRGAELWLGETSSCYGGGAPDLSNTYVAGFMYGKHGHYMYAM